MALDSLYRAGIVPLEGIGPCEAVPEAIPVGAVLVFGLLASVVGLEAGVDLWCSEAGSDALEEAAGTDFVGFIDGEAGAEFFGLGSPLSPGLPPPFGSPLGGLKPFGSRSGASPLMMSKAFCTPSGNFEGPHGSSQF